MSSKINKVSLTGIIIALGIVFGDIGTSPLYTMSAIIRNKVINETLILGGLSLIIWTLTLQTTIKYVWLTLKADNNGEGGIFSLYALVRKHSKKIVLIAMVGGASLLADGVITPSITVTSAIEGLHFEKDTTLSIVCVILFIVFFMQQFGTNKIGKMYGPVMLLWFVFMAVTGYLHLNDYFNILKAFNPMYGINYLFHEPKGFWVLGAVFLCTTGAESLYSDLGHCGRKNIRAAWIFVKIALLLNYFGQGAYLLSNYSGQTLPDTFNPFFAIIPPEIKPFGIGLAVLAAIIACQALISGAFSLISEAIKLNLWPKLRIVYPSTEKGQLYVPIINWALFLGCIWIVFHFGNSASMEGAYGLSITLTMIMTSVLFAFYLKTRKINKLLIFIYLAIYLTIETCFLIGNLEKFEHGGKVTVMIAAVLFLVMYIWFRARKIKNRYVDFVHLDEYIPILQDLSNDRQIPKYATHLVYLTSADNKDEIEHKVMHSIFYQKPKRADIYWFVHVDVVDDPYRSEYNVTTIIPNEIIRIDLHLGFKIEQRVHSMFKKIVEDLVRDKEVSVVSRYDSLSKNKMRGDFRFVVLEKYLSKDNRLSFIDKFVMNGYFLLKKISLTEEKSFGLESSDVTVEKYPLIISNVNEVNLVRVNN